MLKKMMLLAMAVGALVAFAAPAMAQAETTVTDTSGKPATTFTATSSNLIITTSVGRLTCNTVHITGNVTNGSPATLSAIHGTATSDIPPFKEAAECPILNEKNEVVTAARITGIGGSMSLEGGEGSLALFFHLDLTVAPGLFSTCGLVAGEPGNVRYGESEIEIPSAELEGSEGSGCPSLATLSGDLNLDGSIDN